MEKNFICCICQGSFKGYGNNPQGAAWKNQNGQVEIPTYNVNERCCDECNSRYVIPGRIYQMKLQRQKESN